MIEIEVSPGAAYIHLYPEDRDRVGIVASSKAMGRVVLDYDWEGNLFGVELLDAVVVTPSEP